MEMEDEYSFGSTIVPPGVCCDGTYIYVIAKYEIVTLDLDFNLVDTLTTFNGADNFTHASGGPRGICCDDAGYIYVGSYGQERIVKFTASGGTLTYDSEIAGDYPFLGLDTNGTYLFACTGLLSTIEKRNCGDLSYITAKWQQFRGYNDVCHVGDYIYVTSPSGTYGDAIQKRNISDMEIVSSFGSTGSGDNQFDDPIGIATDGVNLYICDRANGRIKRHLLDGTYIDEATDNITYVWGIDVVSTVVWKLDSSEELTWGPDIVKVEEGSAELSVEVSLQDCKDNPGSFFYDTDDGALYIHTSGSDNPSNYNIVAYFWGKFCSQQPLNNPVIFSDDYYLPLLDQEKLPSITSSVPEFFQGGKSYSFGSLELFNDEGWWDTKRATYIFENQEILMLVGEEGDAYGDYVNLSFSTISLYEWSDLKITLQLAEPKNRILKPIPNTFFNLSDYPNMDADFVGEPIPEFWGPKTNITPILVDAQTSTYQICARTLSSFDAIRLGGVTLGGGDYSEDLANGKFSFTSPAPYLEASTLYYLIMCGDFAISTNDFIWWVGKQDNHYADGTFYTIDELNNWTDLGYDMLIELWGINASNPSGAEEQILTTFPGTGAVANETLRFNTDHTRLAQSFTMPAGDNFYLTKVVYRTRQLVVVTDVVGNIWFEVHSDQAGTQVGGDSALTDGGVIWKGGTVTRNTTWESLDTTKEISVDATAPNPKAKDILEDAIVNLMGADSSVLDAAMMAALETDLQAESRDFSLGIYLNQVIEGDRFINALERSCGFLFLPLLDGTFGPVVYTSGEPAGTPHLKDGDYSGFRQVSDPRPMNNEVIVYYDRNPTDRTTKNKKATSTTAADLYRILTTFEVDTYLTEAADGSAMAAWYLSLMEVPILRAFFSVPMLGFNKYPGQKVKLTRDPADDASGVLSAVLYRIIRSSKSLSNGMNMVEAILDSLSIGS